MRLRKTSSSVTSSLTSSSTTTIPLTTSPSRMFLRALASLRSTWSISWRLRMALRVLLDAERSFSSPLSFGDRGESGEPISSAEPRRPIPSPLLDQRAI